MNSTRIDQGFFFLGELCATARVGRGTITLVRENKRHSINVEEGDIVKVEAGTPVYMINRDRNQKLVVVKLIQPVNLPGHFEVIIVFVASNLFRVLLHFLKMLTSFFVLVNSYLQKFHGAGGQNPESFYTAFSWEVLQAALKVIN